MASKDSLSDMEDYSTPDLKNPGLALVVAMLILAGLLLGASETIPTGNAVSDAAIIETPAGGAPPPSPGQGTVRVLITPRTNMGHTQIRKHEQVKIRHDWKGRFSADVPSELIPNLLLDADVSQVEVLDLHQGAWQFPGEIVKGLNSAKTTPAGPKRPVCGDKICQGKEKTTCPSDCQPSSVRTCTPSTQRDYNVVQVGGGQQGVGAGVNVAVLDTGTTPTHFDIKSNLKVCVSTTGIGVSSGCQDMDSVAHGTHTTGIVAANGGPDGLGIFGVSPSANLFAIKVCGSSGCYADDIAEGIDYGAQAGAHIISMSFGGASESALIRDAILRHPDVLFIASSGNSGPAENTINYPAAHSAVVAVAANDQNTAVTWFSSRGLSDGIDTAISAREVELSAGGLNIEAPNSDGCYSRLSGTSFSAPTISGIAAKAWDQADGVVDGKGDAASVRRFLISHAKDLTAADGGGAGPGYDIASGYGLPVVS